MQDPASGTAIWGEEVVKGFAFPTDFLGDSKSYWNLRNKGLVISEPEGKMWKQVAVTWVHMCLREWILRANKTYSFYSINIYWLVACWALPVVVFSPSFSSILFFYLKSLHDVGALKCMRKFELYIVGFLFLLKPKILNFVVVEEDISDR